MAWNSEGGGFEVSPSDQSQSVSKERGIQEKTGIKPLCISTIYKSFIDDAFQAVDGTSLNQVTIVAKVLEAESNSQRYEYKLGDGSGEVIVVREYINDEDSELPELVPVGKYVRVYATLKSFQGSPHLVSHRIAEIKDPNEITTHLLECVHTYLKMKQTGDGAAGGVIDKNADVPEQVRAVIQSNKTMTGISVSEIKSTLPHITHDKIMQALNYLSGEGFIFSTVDEEHFRATEDS